MKLLFLSLLVTYSCTKYVKLERDAVSAHLEGVKMPISSLNEIKWPAGFREESPVSQSITFTIDMPKVNQDDLDYLTQVRDVDAWIIRVIAHRKGEKQDLGSLYSLFRPRKMSRTSTGAASSVTLKIYYAAAYASERWRTSKCPPLGHDKRISGLKIDDDQEEFTISVGGAQSYPEKSQLIELTPSDFNGGTSLAGEYTFEIAPYNSQKKMIHSPFKRIPGKVVVESEQTASVPACK